MRGASHTYETLLHLAGVHAQLCACRHRWGHPRSPRVHPCRFLPQGLPHTLVSCGNVCVPSHPVHVFAVAQGARVCMRMRMRTHACACAPLSHAPFVSGLVCVIVRPCVHCYAPHVNVHAHTHTRTHARTHAHTHTHTPFCEAVNLSTTHLPFNTVLLHTCSVSLRILSLRVAHTV